MKDYRYLTYPDKNKKMNTYIILNMIKLGLTTDEIIRETKSKRTTIDELKKHYEKALKDDKKKISDFKDISGDLKAE